MEQSGPSSVLEVLKRKRVDLQYENFIYDRTSWANEIGDDKESIVAIIRKENRIFVWILDERINELQFLSSILQSLDTQVGIARNSQLHEQFSDQFKLNSLTEYKTLLSMFISSWMEAGKSCRFPDEKATRKVKPSDSWKS